MDFLAGSKALKKAAGTSAVKNKTTQSANLPIADIAAEDAKRKLMQEQMRKRQKQNSQTTTPVK